MFLGAVRKKDLASAKYETAQLEKLRVPGVILMLAKAHVELKKLLREGALRCRALCG
jgi:hypothetical protein